MKFSPTKIISLIALSLVVILSYSCNKDSDLLADYVIDENGGKPGNLINLENGTFITSEDKLIAINIRRDEQSSTDRIGIILQEVTQPENGKTEIQTDSTIIYTPDENFNGKDDFTYVVEETGPDENTVQKENTVVVEVNPVLETKEDKVKTDADKKAIVEVLKNDTYADKNTATVANTSTPAKGTVTINKDNTLTYTPNTDASGEDTFTYTAEVKGTNNTVSKKEGKVTVDITAVETPQDIAMGELLAFPGAVGFGKNTTGGRGGSVIEVTNLNDSGPGSFRAALTAKGTRTVVFRVGGTINLGSSINIYNGNLTIAGQTAPGGGVLLKGGGVVVQSSNVIIRYIRFRPGPTSPSDSDAFSITAPSGTTVQNVIVDHCSFSWGRDENFNMMGSSSSTVKNITVQNCIISESGYGVLLYRDVQNASFYQNLFALNDQRNLRANWGYHSDVLRFEMVNNLIFGWWRGATVPSNGLKYTILNNKYKTSSQIELVGDGTTVIAAQPADASAQDSWTYAYIDGNIIPSGLSLDNSRAVEYLKKTPYLSSDITSTSYPASEIEGKILTNVGASLPTRDAVDARIVKSYQSGTGTFNNTGSYPSIANGTPYRDSDGDGIEDSWELANNLKPSDKSDGSIERNGESYTNLEAFLHYLTIK